jgi:hypothetical protein
VGGYIALIQKHWGDRPVLRLLVGRLSSIILGDGWDREWTDKEPGAPPSSSTGAGLDGGAAACLLGPGPGPGAAQQGLLTTPGKTTALGRVLPPTAASAEAAANTAACMREVPSSSRVVE